MPQYPNYYPQMNNYGQQYNPQQPYMDRLANLQQYQQNLQMLPTQMPGATQQQQFQQMTMGINGKIVASVENITANDVPMDGSVAFFPKQDMSEIYVKSWNSDGTIKTVTYKPFMDNPNNLSNNEENIKIGLSDEATEAFMKRFDELEKRLDDFGLTLTKSSTKNPSSRAKKEAGAE